MPLLGSHWRGLPNYEQNVLQLSEVLGVQNQLSTNWCFSQINVYLSLVSVKV